MRMEKEGGGRAGVETSKRKRAGREVREKMSTMDIEDGNATVHIMPFHGFPEHRAHPFSSSAML